MNTFSTSSVTKLLKAFAFSCVGGAIVSVTLVAIFVFVAYKVITLSHEDDERVRNLPEVKGTLITLDSTYISPIGKKPASLVVLFINYFSRVNSTGRNGAEHNTFILPMNLRFRVGNKNYTIQPPKFRGYLGARAALHFPGLHKSDQFQLDWKGAWSPLTIEDHEIPPALFGNEELIDCILQDLASETGPCAKKYSKIIVKEYYYEPNEVVALKGKIEGDKFILFDITDSKDSEEDD